MGLQDIVRNAVAIANKVTAPLQTTVTHEAWIGADKYGKPQFDLAVIRPALIERKTAAVGGSQITQNATVYFLSPVEEHGADDRQEPLDPRDRITLPDGWTGPIVNVEGLIDPATNLPYLYTVALGNPGAS
ncbi:MAG TPA: hypothetical protein VMZ92_08635 [Planctomycetota bacterium]|nr:hypothetical protein [Planctomycetota bacterium]